ncbi:MAG: enhanced serine sensitivity protein SseB C-terminal domain-containing protein [Saccharofermentans sp.]|nr:enhanced serine sensitivity protein SseB C-terminal domain-containing protein [Saccharofermentans sp.]
MSDKENNIFELEGDALDEALLAAIEATDEEERLAREKRIRENQERAEQARITAIEQEKTKAKIDELRKTLPNEGRRYFLMAEEAECSEDNNEAVLTGIVYGTCKKDDEVYLYRTDGKVLGTKVRSVEVFNGKVFEPADEINQTKGRITITVDYKKTGFTADNAIPKFSVLSSVKPPVKDENGKVAIENPILSGLMFRYPEYNKDKEYIARLMDGIANGRFLVPGMSTDEKPGPNGRKKMKIIMINKKNEPDKRVLPLFTDLQALYLWRKLFEGEKKPSVIVMSFAEAAKFVSKDGFDIVFNPSGPVSFGLPNKVVSTMSGIIDKHQASKKPDREVINDGSKVVVGDPRPGEETDNVKKAMIDYCRNDSSISSAALMIIIRNGKISYLVIVDAPKASSQTVFQGITKAMKPYFDTIKSVDFSLLSETPFATDIFKKKAWDYKRV